MASFVPDPIEKCAVWAASPSSTTLPRCQLSLRTSRKLVHSERLVMRRWPFSSSENSASHARSDSASSICVEAQRAPRVLRGLDDPGARVLVEGVRVDLDEPGLGLLEDEGEGVEHEVGAEPDVLAALRGDAFAEVRRVGLAHEAVDAVRADDEVRVRELAHLAFEAQVDAQPVRPPLQDLQEQLPWDGRERVPARAHLAPAVVDVDRRPAREGVGDLEVGFRVGVAQGAQGLLGEDDAEPEGRVGRVALEDRDVVARLLHQDREVQARRTGTDDAHLHASTSASRSNCPMSATVGKRISSSQPASS